MKFAYCKWIDSGQLLLDCLTPGGGLIWTFNAFIESMKSFDSGSRFQ